MARRDATEDGAPAAMDQSGSGIASPVTVGSDGIARCAWGAGGDPLVRAYHDTEWGRPSHDERHLFEMLVLEGAQAGLSWTTILHKREGYRRAFAGFDADVVAGFSGDDVTRLMADAGIVRNRAKIDATIANAGALLALIEEDFGHRVAIETARWGSQRFDRKASLITTRAASPATIARRGGSWLKKG